MLSVPGPRLPSELLLCAESRPVQGGRQRRRTQWLSPRTKIPNWETEAKGGGPNLCGCELPTFSPSSPGHSHLCLEGRGGPRGQKRSCPRGPQLEGILGWLPGHLRPCPAPFCPCGCVNSRGPPVPQKVGALTVLFVEAGKQARRLRVSPGAHSGRLLWSEQTSTARYVLCYGNTSPSGRLKGLQSLSPDGPDSGTRPACCLF